MRSTLTALTLTIALAPGIAAANGRASAPRNAVSTPAMQRALTQATATFAGKRGLVSISIYFNQSNTIIVIFDRKATPSLPHLPNKMIVGRSTYAIIARFGPPIKSYVGNLITDRPIAQSSQDGFDLGGDLIETTRRPGWYGTIGGIFSQAGYTVRSMQRHYGCTVDNAILSNNHVIAASDAGAAGDKLTDINGNSIGNLVCYIPLADRSVSADFAIGKIGNTSSTKFGYIRGIGYATGVRKPGGEPVQKSGARTGVTHGQVLGMASIWAEGRSFDNIYFASGGFSCPGDSGSLVLGMDRNILGIVTWGEDKACQDQPLSYFWRVLDPGYGGLGKLKLSH